VRANRSPYNRPEPVEETAETIGAAGGSAVALRVDHTMEGEVEALFQRVERERGRLDVLVNSIAGGDPAILERTGPLCSSWELGREYRFTDSDGRRPDWGASKIDFSKHPEQLRQLLRTGSEIQLRWLSELRRKTKHFLTQLPQTS
jgi:NAD(P)-dependent dehydrogenase (short-subunit alcohol dehydrogenase family)